MNTSLIPFIFDVAGDYVFRIIESPNWKGGKPVDPSIPKWLIQITHKQSGLCHVPTDQQLRDYAKILPLEATTILEKYLVMKENHNRSNLKNPEKRKIEDCIFYIHKRRREDAELEFYKIGDDDD